MGRFSGEKTGWSQGGEEGRGRNEEGAVGLIILSVNSAWTDTWNSTRSDSDFNLPYVNIKCPTPPLLECESAP